MNKKKIILIVYTFFMTYSIFFTTTVAKNNDSTENFYNYDFMDGTFTQKELEQETENYKKNKKNKKTKNTDIKNKPAKKPPEFKTNIQNSQLKLFRLPCDTLFKNKIIKKGFYLIAQESDKLIIYQGSKRIAELKTRKHYVDDFYDNKTLKLDIIHNKILKISLFYFDFVFEAYMNIAPEQNNQ